MSPLHSVRKEGMVVCGVIDMSDLPQTNTRMDTWNDQGLIQAYRLEALSLPPRQVPYPIDPLARKRIDSDQSHLGISVQLKCDRAAPWRRIGMPLYVRRAVLVRTGSPRSQSEPIYRRNVEMDTQETAHADHVAHSQDHYRWRRDHLEALAILKRAEAAILSYQARILAHDAEIARHEEDISHGDASHEHEHDHDKYARAHQRGREHNQGLLDAIGALVPHLPNGA